MDEEQFATEKKFGVSLQMRKIRLLAFGLILALIIGAVVFFFWNQIIGFLTGIAVFAIIVIVALAGIGESSDDDEDDEDEDDEDDDDD